MSHPEYSQFDKILELVKLYEEAVSKNENLSFSEEDYEDLIHFYLDNNQAQSALEASEMALKVYPFSSEFSITKADACLELGQLDEAEETLLNNFQIDLSDVNYYLILAEIYLIQENYEKSFEILDRGMTFCKEDKDALLIHKSEVYKDSGEFELMIPLLKEAIDLNPSNSHSYYLISLAFSLCNLSNEKIEYFNELIDRDPFNTEVWLQLAYAYNDIKNYDKAVESYEYLIAIEGHTDYYIDLAKLYYDTLEIEKAIDCIMEIKKTEELDIFSLSLLGMCYKELSDYKKAKKYFQEALILENDNSKLYYELANIYYLENNIKSAFPLIKKALELEPDNLDFKELYANILSESGETEISIRLYTEILEVRPEKVELYFNLSLLLCMEEQVDLAHTVLDFAILNYHLNILNFYKSILYFKTEEYKKGYKYFKLGLETTFSDYHIVFELVPELIHDVKIKELIAKYTPNS